MKQLNILLANFEFPPYPLAGTGTYALVLSKELIRLGHNVTILTPNHSGNDSTEKVEGVTVKRVDVSDIQLINKFTGQAKTNRSFLDKKTLFALALKNYIKKHLNLDDYDLYHSLNERDAAFLDFTYMNKHLPTILSVNDYYIIGSSLNPLKFEFKSTDLPLRYAHHNFMKRFYMKALKNCTAIIPNSYFVGNLIQNVVHIPKEKIHVVQRGINTQVKKYYSLDQTQNVKEQSLSYKLPQQSLKSIQKQHSPLLEAALGDTNRKLMILLKNITYKA